MEPLKINPIETEISQSGHHMSSCQIYIEPSALVSFQMENELKNKKNKQRNRKTRKGSQK